MFWENTIKEVRGEQKETECGTGDYIDHMVAQVHAGTSNTVCGHCLTVRQEKSTLCPSCDKTATPSTVKRDELMLGTVAVFLDVSVFGFSDFFSSRLWPFLRTKQYGDRDIINFYMIVFVKNRCANGKSMPLGKLRHGARVDQTNAQHLKDQLSRLCSLLSPKKKIAINHKINITTPHVVTKG